jgi:hypothetical protein
MSPDQIFVVALIAIIPVVLLLSASVVRSEEGEMEVDIFGVHFKWRFKKAPEPKPQPKLPEAIRLQIHSAIDQYNRCWLSAIASNDYRQLRIACTARYYLAQEQRFQNDQSRRHAVGATTITFESLEILDITMTDDHSAEVRTDERWQTAYRDGRKALQTAPNIYTIKQEGGHWCIDQVENPAGGTTTWT